MGYLENNHFRTCLMATVGASALLFATPGQAQTSRFDVAAQPAATGIPLFGRQAGLQIVAARAAVEGQRVNAVAGVYTASEGLALLLRGTNLTVVSNNGRTIVLARKASSQSTDNVVAPRSGGAVASAPAGEDKVSELVVVGTRASIQSAINRKKTSNTSQDSIVAEDVGKFPDKNIGEALSRVAGIQLSREMGEGTQVTIRGIEPDLNRVEINGISVLSTNGGPGRGAEFRQLQSELIESVDVIKGTTAEITEGGIGGTVRINTRKPLDFRKPTYSITLSGQHLTTVDGVTPRVNVIASRKFFDDRLGVLANITYDSVTTRTNTPANASSGWIRTADWDLSPEKTIVSLDPLAAAVTTFGGCNAVTTANNSRQLCYNQWYDFHPGNTRNSLRERDDERISAEFTLQYKVNDNFRLWSTYLATNRNQVLRDYNQTYPSAGTFRLSSAGATPGAGEIAYIRDGQFIPSQNIPNVVPGSVTVSANHNVTGYTLLPYNPLGTNRTTLNAITYNTNAGVGELDIEGHQLSFGGNYVGEKLRVQFQVADQEQAYKSDARSVTYDAAVTTGLKVVIDPVSGLPLYTPIGAFDFNNPAVYTAGNISWNPNYTDSSERIYKIDAQWFAEDYVKVSGGLQFRSQDTEGYTNGGATVHYGSNLLSNVDDTVIWNARVTHTFATGRVVTTPAPAAYVNYTTDAAVPSTTSPNVAYQWTPATFAQFVTAFSTQTPGVWLGGWEGKNGQVDSWLTPDVDGVFNSPLIDKTAFNLDTLYEAPGRNAVTGAIILDANGNPVIYPQQPNFKSSEETLNLYGMTDWTAELFGRTFTANIGARYIGVDTIAKGVLTRTERRDGVNNGNVVTVSRQVSEFKKTTRDVLPSINLALWLAPDELVTRAHWGKVVTRPRIDRMLSTGTCAFDFRAAANPDADALCTVGNPGLRSYEAEQSEIDIEWYPNRDTQLSLGLFYKDIVNEPSATRRTFVNVDYFGDGTLVDVSTFINLDGNITKGFEISAKTAFTFLPAPFDGLGADANYTRNYSNAGFDIEPITGLPIALSNLSKFSYNLALWYEKGPFGARVAYHYRDRYYRGINQNSATNPGYSNWTDASGYLDAKFSYDIPSRGLSFFLEGKNLTDQFETRDGGEILLNPGGDRRLEFLDYIGRRYYAGVTMKF